ncbi:MAG: hypothetical protein ACO3UU_03390 [Minisyncoccia bacterium]
MEHIQNIQICETLKNYDIYTLSPKNYVGNETIYVLLYVYELRLSDYRLEAAILEPGKTYSLYNLDKKDKLFTGWRTYSDKYNLISTPIVDIPFKKDRWKNGSIIEYDINEFRIWDDKTRDWIKFNKKHLNKYIEEALTVYSRKFFYIGLNQETINPYLDDFTTMEEKRIKNFINKYNCKTYKLDTKVCNLNETDFTVPKLTIWNVIHKILKKLYSLGFISWLGIILIAGYIIAQILT